MVAAVCRSSVDFPMPGSPPIRTAEPGTSPPPRARSNSASPVDLRTGSSVGRLRGTNSIPRPPLERSCFWENTVAGASSTIVFHSAQSAHCPCHPVETAPHAWHTYRFFAFAMRGAITRTFTERNCLRLIFKPSESLCGRRNCDLPWYVMVA